MAKNTCLTCGLETSNPKYCSKSCAAKNNNKIPKRNLMRKCSRCDNIIRNYKSLLCEEHFQEDQKNKRVNIEKLSLSEYTERLALKDQHPSSKFAHIRGFARSWFKSKSKLPCYVCGYDKHVELAHIKPISSFLPTDLVGDINSEDNIVQLCPNCHWEFDAGLITLDFPDQPESQ